MSTELVQNRAESIILSLKLVIQLTLVFFAKLSFDLSILDGEEFNRIEILKNF
jgi:hypothetical protein